MSAEYVDIVFTPNEITTMKYELLRARRQIPDTDLKIHYQQIIEKLNAYYKAIT